MFFKPKRQYHICFFFHYYARMQVDSYGSLTIEKTLIFHNIIILIKSALSKDQNHYYYNKFSEKCLYQLAKKYSKICLWLYNNIEIWRDKNNKRKVLCRKKIMNIWQANIDNIVISKLIKAKTNSKYLIGYLDQVTRPLVLILPRMSGYVKTFKVKDKNNKLMPFCIDDEKLLEKYKTIWTKIEDLKNI